ncbi:MAG: peptide deformylase [Rectinemataceae bacterium]
MLDIVTFGSEAGDAILRAKAEPIKDVNADIKALAAAMLESMEHGRGIGLAAPQVDRGIRLFVTRLDDDEPRVFINPEILLVSEELVDYEEGCLSLPGLYTNVRRADSVKVRAWNARGKPFTLEASGLLARVILHENDHLEGLLFIDRLGEKRRQRAVQAYLKKIRM